MHDRTTQILKSQHVLIKELLLDSMAFGIGTYKGKKAFNQARKILKKYQELENLRLYPGLLHRPKFAAIKESFSREMNGLYSKVDDILEHHKNGYHAAEFQNDISKVIELLELRFEKEERDLFHAYDRGTSYIKVA